MRKSTEAIKTACGLCIEESCGGCAYLPDGVNCGINLLADALELIEELETLNDQRRAALCDALAQLREHERKARVEPEIEPDEAQEHDPVSHPSHYTQGGVECIKAIEAATIGLEGMEAVDTAQVLKYLWRWKHKNGLEDLNKADWYLQELRARVQGRE